MQQRTPLIPAPGNDEDAQHEEGTGEDGEGEAKGIHVLDPHPDHSRHDEDDVAADSIDPSPLRTLILIVDTQVGEGDSRDDDVDDWQPGALLEEVVDEIGYFKEEGRGEFSGVVVVGDGEEEVEDDADHTHRPHHYRHRPVTLLQRVEVEDLYAAHTDATG